MIGEDVFAVEPWAVRERELHLDLLAETESILALSNGHIGLRANLDEGEPAGTPGTYLNAFYETRPLPHAEAAYGNPEDAQTLLNVTNGKIIRLLVDDEPFDIRYGQLLRHERVLDFREGVLTREVEWISPAGQGIRLRTTRLVSFVQRAVAAIRYEVEPIDAGARIVVQSELVANEPLPEAEDDPRAAAVLDGALVPEHHGHHDLRAGLVHRTRASGLLMAAAMDHVVDGPEGTVTEAESEPDLARVTITTALDAGQPLRLVKLLAYGWSSQRTLPSVRDQVEAALSSAKRTGWDGLRALPARVPRRRLGPRRRRARRRPRAPAGGALLLLPRAPGRRPRREPGDPGQGADRPRLRRPQLLGHGHVHGPGADVHGAGRGRRRAALAALDARPRRGPRPRAAARGRGVPVAHDPRARSARATGRRARRRCTSTPTSPTRSAATSSPPRTRRSRRARRSSCSSAPRGCGARSATTSRPAASGSTA